MKKRIALAMTAAMTAGAIAGAYPDKLDIKKFIMTTFPLRPDIHVKDVKSYGVEPVPGKEGWSRYRFSVVLQMPNGKTVVSPPTAIFYDKNSGVVAVEIIDAKTGQNYAETMHPKFPMQKLDKKHLLVGNPNAKYKVVVFSDPQCPFCKQSMPTVERFAKAHPDTMAIYYYHYPLANLHPAAHNIAMAMEALKKKGMGPEALGVYQIPFSRGDTSFESIARQINAHIPGANLTAAEINTEENRKAVESDMALGNSIEVTGTPTVFINGYPDPKRANLAKIITGQLPEKKMIPGGQE